MIPEKLGSKENPKRDIHGSSWEGKKDKICWVNWERGRGRKEGESGGGRREEVEEHEGMGFVQNEERPEGKWKEKDILIEGTIMVLPVAREIPRNYNDDPR